MNFLHVEEAKHIESFNVWMKFNDGTEGVVDLSDSLDGPVFEPLRDEAFFKGFKLEGHTLSWKNGADFSPDYLRDKAQPIGGGNLE
jgi:hypothetical protein